jgi:hypothetical protein
MCDSLYLKKKNNHAKLIEYVCVMQGMYKWQVMSAGSLSLVPKIRVD